jgi:ParB-like chromosome segregation protein Spo0J
LTEEFKMSTSDGDVFVQLEVALLKTHPEQERIFGKANEHEIEELATDMAKNGQLQEIEILPDGTQLTGHKRRLAAMRLGWKHLRARVRHDLADNPADALRRLVEDNLYRRQQSPLGIARCYRQLKMLESHSSTGRLYDSENKELREVIANRMGGNVSGRTLDRHLRIVEHTPVEVQHAADSGRLPMGDAEKVAGLPEQQKDEIAEEIRNGGDPKKVVRRVIAEAPRREKNVYAVQKAFIPALERWVEDLGNRVDEMRSISTKDEQVLVEGEKLIRQVLNLAKQRRQNEGDLLELPELLAGLGKGSSPRHRSNPKDEGHPPVNMAENKTRAG